MKKTLMILLVLLVSSCASTPLLKHTQSGKPEGIYRNKSIAEVKEIFMQACAVTGADIEKDTTNTLICSKIDNSRTSAYIMGLSGANSYEKTMEKLSFVFVKEGANSTKVILSRWIERPNNFGAIKRFYFNSNKHRNAMQQQLWDAGAE